MRPSTAAQLRYWILFWIAVPIGAAATLYALFALLGLFIGPHAPDWLAGLGFGLTFLTLVVSVAAAHAVVTTAIAGLCAIAVGLRADWRLLLAIVVGVAAGTPVLYRLYFAEGI